MKIGRTSWAAGTTAICLCFGLLAPAGMGRVVAAANVKVKVSLPAFTVTLNGHTVENHYREYPLLVYKDITYFPMTWYDARLLGLEASWSQEYGLDIAAAGVASSYFPYKSDQRNVNSYSAEVPASDITINGTRIDNSKEPYPLLSFRDVTYFPLTWRFAHDEFGWDYKWDQSEGLRIESHNPRLEAVELPGGPGGYDVALFNGYYYFNEIEGTTTRVYRTPAGQLSDREVIYTFTNDIGDGSSRSVAFHIRENNLWLIHHVGGAIMGHDVFVKVNDDGTTEVIHEGYLDFRNTPYGTLMINLGVPPSAGNLSLKTPGQEGRFGTPIGNPDLMYARYVEVDDSHTSVSSDSSSTTVIGDHVVVVMATKPYDDLNKIYKVNLRTNETVKIIDSEVRQFRMVDSMLYYIKDADRSLYVSDLDGQGESKLSDTTVEWFGAAGGSVYYTTEAEDGNYRLYRVNPDGEDPLVLQEWLDSVQLQEDQLICLLEESEDYGALVLDSSGRVLLSVADPVSRILTSDDSILLDSARDDSVLILR